ncbi:MAG: putative porin [Oleiphilaceae bacterium]|jgi:predicted porin
MKKTILASAILLVAGAANAAEVYNNEGATVTLGGSFRGHAIIEKSDDVRFEDAGSRFDLKAAKELDDGLKVIGTAEIKYTDLEDADEKVTRDASLYLNKAFVGLVHDVYGTATIGKQYGLNDDLVLNDFSYLSGNYSNENNDALGSDATEQLKYVNSFSGAMVVVSLMDEDTYAIGGTYEVAGLTLGATYNIANDRPATGTTSPLADNSSLLLGAQYSIDALTVGASYVASEINNADTSSYGVGAKYTLGQAGLYAMYDIYDGDLKSDEKAEMVLGADYELAEGVIAYAEFVSTDLEVETVKKTDNNVMYIGGRFYF